MIYTFNRTVYYLSGQVRSLRLRSYIYTRLKANVSENDLVSYVPVVESSDFTYGRILSKTILIHGLQYSEYLPLKKLYELFQAADAKEKGIHYLVVVRYGSGAVVPYFVRVEYVDDKPEMADVHVHHTLQ